METGKPTKTSLGLNENLEALLCYLLTWVSGFVFILIEKENNFVRFHAMQSIITFLPLLIISFVAGKIPFLGGFISFIIGILELVLWILLMYKAFQGEKYKLPFAGDIAEQQLNK